MMMNSGDDEAASPKENANPTIVATAASSWRSKRPKALLQYPELAALSLTQPTTTSRASPVLRVEDRILLRALVDSAAASNGKTVSLLRNVGLNIPQDPSQLIGLQREPLFVPAAAAEEFTSSSSTDTTRPRDKIAPISNSTISNICQRDPVDVDEIFEIIRNIQDPEHPLTLEQLGVVSRDQITIVEHEYNYDTTILDVCYTPTIPHCSMATLIGLCLRVKLWRSLPVGYKVTVRIQPGTHQSEHAVNKQLADKERVCAALENKHLLGLVNKCIAQGMMTTTTHHGH